MEQKKKRVYRKRIPYGMMNLKMLERMIAIMWIRLRS